LKNFIGRIYVLKPIFNGIFLLSIGFIVFLFIFSSIDAQNQFALPSLMLAVWSLLFSALLGLTNNVPVQTIEKPSWFSKIYFKFRKVYFRFIALMLIFVTLALIYLSFRLFSAVEILL